jgi:hypothetical protein
VPLDARKPQPYVVLMPLRPPKHRPSDSEHLLDREAPIGHPQIALGEAEAIRLLNALNETDEDTVARLRGLREQA